MAVIDEEFNYAEALSPMIKILDLTAPTIVHRTPGAASRHVGRSANVHIRFSEPVVVTSRDVKLREAGSGRAVAVTVHWDKRTNTLLVDPVRALGAHTRYRVEVGSGVIDRGGNHLAPTHWTFTTGS